MRCISTFRGQIYQENRVVLATSCICAYGRPEIHAISLEKCVEFDLHQQDFWQHTGILGRKIMAYIWRAEVRATISTKIGYVLAKNRMYNRQITISQISLYNRVNQILKLSLYSTMVEDKNTSGQPLCDVIFNETYPLNWHNFLEFLKAGSQKTGMHQQVSSG